MEPCCKVLAKKINFLIKKSKKVMLEDIKKMGDHFQNPISGKLIKLNLTIYFSHFIYCMSHYEGKVDADAGSC